MCSREIPIVSIHFCPMPAAHLACLPSNPPPSPPTPPHAPGGLDMYLTGCSLGAGYGGAGAAIFAPLPTAPCAVLVGCSWAMWRAGYGGAGAAVLAPLPTAPCAVLVRCPLGARWVLVGCSLSILLGGWRIKGDFPEGEHKGRTRTPLSRNCRRLAP